MSIAISGMGWVTPLGAGTDEVWQRLMAGEQGKIEPVQGPNGRTWRCMPVPEQFTAPVAKIQRLRRAGKISYMTAAAGLAAIDDAGLKMSPDTAARTALIFAITSGGVVHTRRFFEPIAAHGANAASPLLFPETVFNAPASHLAATLGIDGATYTLVGDASVGITALKQAEQLLETGEADYCLVVGGEEVDWVLCAAYGQWRLVAQGHTRQGAVLAEGAAALLLSHEGDVRLTQIHDGRPFDRREKAAAAMKSVLRELTKTAQPDLVISSANGTFIDAAEEAAVRACLNGTAVFSPKRALGEALGASALIQTITAVLALKKNPEENRSVLVSVLGFNQQATGLVCETSRPA